MLPPGVMAFSTAVRFGREGKWASGLGDDTERLAGVEGDGRETLVGASGQDAWAGPTNRMSPPLRLN